MYTGNYVTVDHLMEKIIRDYGFENMFGKDELKEWLYEAMRLIGSYKAYRLRVTDGGTIDDDGNVVIDDPDPITIENYRGKIPGDIIIPIMARDYDSKTPMLCTSSPFRDYGLMDIPVFEAAYTYQLNMHYIFTSFEEGDVELAYLAFPTDEKGEPIIPDDEAYIRAICSYIAERIGFRMLLRKQLEGSVYNKLEQEWLFYVNSAKGSLEQLTIDEAESFKNQWLSLVPKVHLHDEGFRSLTNKRRIKLLNNRVSR